MARPFATKKLGVDEVFQGLWAGQWDAMWTPPFTRSAVGAVTGWLGIGLDPPPVCAILDLTT
jgi:hypothetical protein